MLGGALHCFGRRFIADISLAYLIMRAYSIQLQTFHIEKPLLPLEFAL